MAIEKKLVRAPNPRRLLFKDRFDGQPALDAWNITGEINGHPYDIQTRSYARALEYQRLMDEGDEAGIAKMLAANG